MSEQEILDLKVFAQLQEVDRLTRKGLLDQLIALFEGATPRKLEAVGAAIGRGALAEARALAHTLKSSGGNLGGRRFASICQELESIPDGDDARATALLTDLRREFEALSRAIQAARGPR